MATLTPGIRLGPYEIQSAIGAGGMGEVYKATDTRLDRTVAVKVLPEHVAASPELKQRFEREARTLAALSHPHICPVFDVGDQEGTGFLVMEYLEGQTLAQRLEKGKIPPDQALAYAIQIADALDKAHRTGIVHRDLKPANVMLTRSGVKLLDFGLAKAQPTGAVSGLSEVATRAVPLTAQGTILGTLHYMAPEQVEGREADARSDLFAFGAILYEMVTGRRAFEGQSAASVMAAILERDPPALAGLQLLAPPLLDHIVVRCLAKDPDDRWQSAGDVMRELEWSTREGAQLIPKTSSGTRDRRRERIAWSAAMAALIVSGSFGAMLYVRPAVPDPLVTRLDVVTPPTSEAFSFALSADGRRLAFVANGERGSQLWVRSLDQIAAQPLAGTDRARFPFWAPDGHAIGFFADGKLKRVDPRGGTLQELADAPYPFGGTWNADGVIVFAGTVVEPLMRVSETGGPVTPVTRQGNHRWPQFLPDGRRFLFHAGTSQPLMQGVYVGSLDGSEPTRLMPADTAAMATASGYLLVASQGVLSAYPFDTSRATVNGDPIPVAQSVGTGDQFQSAFSVSAQGALAYRPGTASRRQLAWVDRTGRTLALVGQPDDYSLANPELSRDGRLVAVGRSVGGNNDISLIDVGRGVPNRFTFHAAVENAPIWSPDARELVFRSSRNGLNDLFKKPASGEGDEQPLLVSAEPKSPLDWSRDGFLLYGTRDPKTAADLWALPPQGGRPFPVLHGSFDEIEGQFSPDRRWLAYASNESGHYEIYVRTFPDASGQRQISQAGGTQPRWGRDGRELFFVAPDGRLMVVPIRVTPDAHRFDPGTPVALFPTRLATGQNIAPAGFLARAQYAVSPDGRFLMNVMTDDVVASPITLVLNWTAALKK